MIIKTKVVKIVYYNPSNNWGVLHLENNLEDKKEFTKDYIVATGNFENLYEGCSLEVTGDEKEHYKYGKQIEISHYKILFDVNCKESIVNFLSRSSIKGISTQNAVKIYDRHKDKSIQVVLNSPDELLNINGIGAKTIEKVKSSTKTYKDMEELLYYCTELGFKYSLITKLYKELGNSTLDILKNNIYSILDYTDSISFKQIDVIALNNGYSPDDINRYKYCFLYVLKLRVVYEGSTGIKSQDFKKFALKELGIDNPNMYKHVLDLLKDEDKVYLENNRVYYKNFYDTEKKISTKVKETLSREVLYKYDPKVIDEEIRNFPYVLNKQQLQAIISTLKSEVSIITGPAGTGKSTIQKALVNIFNRHNYNVVLLCPTGKGARRIEECVGLPAQTIHRFLGVKNNIQDTKPPKVEKNSVIFVDEASMMDIIIFEKLLQAFNTDTKLILIGDINQLPSVGAGNVLEDLIESNKINVNILTDIMRQAQDSNIIANCFNINNGINFPTCDLYDFSYQVFYSRNQLLNSFLALYDHEYKNNNLQDIQVLTCYNKEMLGSNSLNKVISEIYNKNVIDEKFQFRVNDKVIHTKNNYQKGVFNGETGVICNIDEDYLTVDYNGVEVLYDTDDIDELSLAYSHSIHKAQGSEYPIVFVLIDDYTSMLLIRKILYTGVSRAKKKVYLLSSNDAVDRCVDNNFHRPRITKLIDFMKG